MEAIIFLATIVRGLDFRRVFRLAEAMLTNGYARNWEPLAVADVDEIDKPVGLLVSLREYIHSNDLRTVKLLDKELDLDRFFVALENVIAEEIPARLTVKSGCHSTTACLIAKCFDASLPPLPLKIVDRKTAEQHEVSDNTVHALSKAMQALELRRIAIELYRTGKIERESDLMKQHGYKKGQAMNSFNSAKLVVDEGMPEDLILSITSQTELSKLAKEPNLQLADVEAVANGQGVAPKALTKKDYEDSLKEFTSDLLKDFIQAGIDGDKQAYVTYGKGIEELIN